jgi:hypothetical protein
LREDKMNLEGVRSKLSGAVVTLALLLDFDRGF